MMKWLLIGAVVGVLVIIAAGGAAYFNYQQEEKVKSDVTKPDVT